LDRPVDDVPRRPPWLDAGKQFEPAFVAPAMRGDRPGNGAAVASRHQDEALPRRGVAIVGGVELAPFRLESEATDGVDPRAKIFALAGLDRLAAARVDRTPAAKLPDILDDQALDAQLRQPSDDMPGVGA